VLHKYTFSVCIPTFDRADKLNELLLNIEDNISDKDRYQIVVSDNASTVETARVVEIHNSRLNIKYIRNDRNVGMSRNIISAVDLADGEYCILTGDDDRFRDGWFGMLEFLVKTHSPDLVISNRFVCDSQLEVKFKEECGPVVETPTTFKIQNRIDLINYLNRTVSTSGFGYLSNLVVKRASWASSSTPSFIKSHAFPHMLKIIDFLYVHGGVILRVPFETVLARSGADRLNEFTGLQNMSDFDKLMIHFEGFLTAAKFLAPDDEEMMNAIINPIRNIFSKEYQDYYIKIASSAGQENRGQQFLSQLLSI
jgi:glycosyltransferase involved in cell wall biosynthesis